MTQYLIIGSGAAGIAACEAIRRNDPKGPISLVCEETAGYYSRPGLAYLLNGEIPEQQLYPFTPKDFQRLAVTRITGQAVSINPQERLVRLHNARNLHYDRLLIATGSSAVPLTVPGSDLKGIVKLDNLSDAQTIIKLARRGRTAVVVGGGITALELAEGLVARGVNTHYFLRGDRYWSNVLDEAEARIVEGRLQDEGIKIHYRTEIVEILGRQGSVSCVRTNQDKTLSCQIVAAAVGVRPRLELGRQAGVSIERGIVVDPNMQTSLPGIFAAGDVAQVFDPHTGKSSLDTLWSAAREQGNVAGTNMAGIDRPLHKSVPFNVTRLSGLTTTIVGAVGHGLDQDLVGIARGDSETWRQLPDSIAAQDLFEVNRLRLLIGPRTLIGAVVMGEQKLSRPIQDLISHRTDITPIRDQLLQPNAELGTLITNYWLSSHYEKKLS